MRRGATGSLLATLALSGAASVLLAIVLRPRLAAAAPTTPAPDNPEADGEPLVLSWSRASLVLEGASDPYNEPLANAVQKARRAGAPSKEVAALERGLETGISSALASTGYGAAVVVVYEALKAILNEIVPLSSGGYEKLSPLQRLRASLFQLLPEFEAQRNQSLFRSQFIDLSNRGTGYADTTFGGDTSPPALTDDGYRTWVRNRLVRMAYRAEFYRVTQTTDEAMLPAAMIQLLMQNRLWPPPLPPIPLQPADYVRQYPAGGDWKYFNYNLGGLDESIVRQEWDRLYETYLRDAELFKQAIAPVRMPNEIRTLAQTQGCIPELSSPANPYHGDAIFSRTGGL